jgi:serine-type D-Ala-D-Ala carboxypeptidase/endopeptidase (penicillin-binding protein 4)
MLLSKICLLGRLRAMRKNCDTIVPFLSWLLLLVVPALSEAQIAPNLPRPTLPASTQPAQPLPTQSPTAAGETRPLYGLQGVLVETLDGKTVAAQSESQPFNPASSVKLATALIALRTLGAQHRFSTGIWSDGTFDKSNSTINGNLYISGRDPSFHYEHAVMIARQLNDLGIRKITGSLVVSPGFTMNFSWSARHSGEQFRDALDAAFRSDEATRAWVYERTALKDQASLKTVPSVTVVGEVQVDSAGPQASLLFTHRSSKLVDILKVLLCYSNNFMAERIGETIGGTESVQRQLVNTLGILPADIQLSTLSGLGINRVTPRAMMKIFRALREELRKNNLSPSDILPVAGIDPGTLQDRFSDPLYRGSVIAKTGTLGRTDGGASSLVGEMRTVSGGTLLFVIMNQHGSVWRFRENQDYLVKQIQNTFAGPKAFAYSPAILTMKLADTESDLAASGEESEPALRANHKSP